MPSITDGGWPLPWNTHGPHHHEEITFLGRVGLDRLRCGNGPVVCRLLFRSGLPAHRLLRLRRQVLRPPVQRLQSGVQRHGLLQWLLPVRPQLWLWRLRTWSVPRRHVSARRLRRALHRRCPLPDRLLRRRGVPGFAAAQRARPRCSRRSEHARSGWPRPGRHARAPAGRPNLASDALLDPPKRRLSSYARPDLSSHSCSANAAADDGRAFVLGRLTAFPSTPQGLKLRLAVLAAAGLVF